MTSAPPETPVSTYRERPAPRALAGPVLCVWSQVIGAGATAYHQRVLPDGCADVVWIGEAPAMIAGPATAHVVVPLAPGTVVVGIRMRPGSAGVLGVPASALRDRNTPLADIWGTAAVALSARVVEQPSVAARLNAAEAALVKRLVDVEALDPLIATATRWLACHPERRVEQLARVLEVGERRLRRRFAATVGYGPKTFQRVLRLQRVLALASRGTRPGGTLAGLAAEAGYADQAHMSRELQALTGRSPGALLRRNATSTLELSDLFKTGPGSAA
jgi:AraC-like DNA-binding protein